MTPDIQPSEEQKSDQQKLKEDFDKALEDFMDSEGEDLTYRELLKSNPSLGNYFKKLIKSALSDNLEIIDLLLSKDPEFSKIKIDNKSILRCLIEYFRYNSFAIISNHINKFASIEDDKDDDNNNNLIASLLIIDNIQNEVFDFREKLIKLLVDKGVRVDDKNNSGKTPLDLCYNLEAFKILAKDASKEALEKKLRHIIENEDPDDEERAIIIFLLTEKNVKIDLDNAFNNDKNISFSYDIVKEHGNEEQKEFCKKIDECKEAIKSFLSTESSDEENLKQLKFVFNFTPNELLDAKVLEKITERYPKFLETQNNIGLNLAFCAINSNKLDALEAIIRARPQVLDQKDTHDLTPVFYVLDFIKLDLLEKIIRARPEVLDHKDTAGLTPVFYAIKEGNLYALEKIIRARPEVLDHKDTAGLTPVFYAIKEGNVYALEKIIRARPEVLDHKDTAGLTPVFYAIWFDKLDALEKIIRARPEVLDHKDTAGLTPVFYAIDRGKLNALEKIIEISEGALEEKNQYGENPILFSLKIYSTDSSEHNKKILKLIFNKQFGRDLQDEEIENLVKFVDNYNFLKLFYNQSGQGMVNNNFKSILSSVLPQEAELEGELSKKILKIYQKIAEAREKPSIIECHDASGDKTKLHIHYSQLNKHASYFIFHVNDQNKLTKISYCDGNRAFPGQEIITRSPYIINGVTTFEITQPQDFNQKFAEDFIKKNSENRKVEEFYSQEFSPEKLASEEKEIFGIKFSKITHSIPTKMQSRGNCPLKSSNILARFLLTHQERKELFTFDTISGVQGGEGYGPYKDLRQKMVDKAVDSLSKTIEQLPKEFTTKLNIYKEISSLYARSKSKIEKQAKKTTKLTPSPSLLDKINREKYLNDIDNITSTPRGRCYMYTRISTSHFNFTDQDKVLIEAISTEEEVKIDGFLTWDFETPQAKNNFVKLVFEHGDEVKKKMFKNQLVASDPEKRNKFFNDLNQESLSLILTEFKIEKLENSDKIITELEGYNQARNKTINEEIVIEPNREAINEEIETEAPSSCISCVKTSCIAGILARIKRLKF